MALLCLLCGCDMSMTQQKKYKTYSPAKLWPNGTSAQQPPAHTVAQDDLTREQEAKTPPKVGNALLARGQQRYNIYCSPCHGIDGRGDGIVVKRGFPHPPSYFEARLMKAPASTFFDTITNGYGVMYPTRTAYRRATAGRSSPIFARCSFRSTRRWLRRRKRRRSCHECAAFPCSVPCAETRHPGALHGRRCRSGGVGGAGAVRAAHCRCRLADCFRLCRRGPDRQPGSADDPSPHWRAMGRCAAAGVGDGGRRPFRCSASSLSPCSIGLPVLYAWMGDAGRVTPECRALLPKLAAFRYALRHRLHRLERCWR